jgi:hydroxymethylbilane synthase
MKTLRLGTRGSQLALWQARTVAGWLRERAGVDCEIVVIKTTGDRLSEANLSAAGGKRLFVKEIEEALLRRDVDLAVHSAKDMPAEVPDGLMVAATPAREDPRDAIVLPASAPPPDGEDPFATLLERLGPSPRVGTSSIRRITQLSRAMPGASFEPIRGNLDTRLRKLDEGPYAALVLAAAGLKRLGFGGRISALVPVERCIPAPNQGALAIETRANDPETLNRVGRLDDPVVRSAVDAERALVEALGGGCQIPLGALAVPVDGDLDLRAIVTSPDGRVAIVERGRGPARDAAAPARRDAPALHARGAGPLLDQARNA